jgi:hypothetical protein
MTNPIIDQDMYKLLLETQNDMNYAIRQCNNAIHLLERMQEDIDNKLSEYDTTEDAKL